MTAIIELSGSEIAQVSGGGHGDGADRSSSSDGSNSGGGGAYSGVDSCGAGIFGGMIAGMPAGPIGMAAGIVGGMVAGQCNKDSFSNKSDNDGRDSSNWGGPGQCSW